MIQRHSIILWKKADEREKSFEAIAEEAFAVLNTFSHYPDEFKLKFLPANSEKEVKEFAWNYNNFKELLKSGVNKEGNTCFEDLGYSVSFFSSMNSMESCSVNVRVGNKNEKFTNTLIVNIPLSFNLYEEDDAKICRKLFVELVNIFQPFWGCISNKVLARKYGKYLDGNLPATIHWMNYWTTDIINSVGLSKILDVVENNQGLEFNNGILKLRNAALNMANENDIFFHESIHKQLFL